MVKVAAGWLFNFLINPNPGCLVANMTSKTLNCCVKFIIHRKIIENFVIFQNHLVFFL